MEIEITCVVSYLSSIRTTTSLARTAFM